MACGGCGGSKKTNFAEKATNVVKNLAKAVVQQPNTIKWFKDGVTGIIKCIEGKTLYSDEQIVKQRDVCRECENSTKIDGKLTGTSQCMAVDPETGAPCACFIICKTQTGTCPLNKWANLTISIKDKET